MIRTAHVLGTGPSLDEYLRIRPEGETYGVNDIDRYTSVENLVIQDRPQDFRYRHQVEAIIHTKARSIFSPRQEWSLFGSRFSLVRVNPVRSDLSTLGSYNRIPHSNNSPFLAAVLAWMRGSKRIYVWGVDLTSHRELGLPGRLGRAVDDWARLRTALDEIGVRVICRSESSALFGVLHTDGASS